MKKFCRVAAVCLALCMLAGISSEAQETARMERIYPYMPEVTVEISGTEELNEENVSASLGDEMLSVEDVHMYDNGRDSSRIYVLADLSTSMIGRLEGLKTQLVSYMDRVGPNDQVVLLTFGESVEQLLEGGEDIQTRKAAVQAMQPDEEGTVLFEALNTAYEISTASQSEFDREYILLLTDGIDFQKGSETYSEIEERFADHILPIYTLCTDNVTQEAADSLGELSRMSGGEFRIVSQGSEEAEFQQLEAGIRNVYLLKFTALSNRISSEPELLQIQAGTVTLEQKIDVTRFIPDSVQPEIKSVRTDGENTRVLVEFSEPVDHVNDNSAVRILDQQDNDIQIRQLEYDEKSSMLYIYPAEKLPAGEYRIVTQGITDRSQEKNPLKADEKSFTAEQISESGTESILDNKIMIAAGILLIIVAAAGIITAVLLVSRKKKPVQLAENEQVIRKKLTEIDGEPKVISETYHVRSTGGSQIRLYIKTADGSERRVSLHVTGSLIFGRGSNCDVVIDDKRMSRQHFAVAVEKANIVIEDLESVNGTKINGIILKGRQFLKPDDRISAGQTEFVITEIKNEADI